MAEHKAELVIDVSGVYRDFEDVHALQGVSLQVAAGEIHALLGPNGAGKTTLLRILTGLVSPTEGSVSVAGIDPADRRQLQRAIGFVPASDRSMYLRLSARENLVFFARLCGYPLKRARGRAQRALESVGLADVAGRRLYTYSHGMLKRLAFARALLTSPRALLVDEATHDLDPEGARTVRQLAEEIAAAGTAILWTTQRVEEIQGFANNVTVLARGTVRYRGSVQGLLARSAPQSFVVTARNGGVFGTELEDVMQRAVGDRGSVAILASESNDSFVLTLAGGVALGEAIAALANAGVTVVGCREERPGVEEAFVLVTSEEQA